MKQIKMVEHYEFINSNNPNEMSKVRLLKSPYVGVVYAYGNVAPVMVNGEAIIKYIYEVYENPNKLDLDNDRDFKNLISEILDEIMNNVFRP